VNENGNGTAGRLVEASRARAKSRAVGDDDVDVRGGRHGRARERMRVPRGRYKLMMVSSSGSLFELDARDASG